MNNLSNRITSLQKENNSLQRDNEKLKDKNGKLSKKNEELAEFAARYLIVAAALKAQNDKLIQQIRGY